MIPNLKETMKKKTANKPREEKLFLGKYKIDRRGVRVDAYYVDEAEAEAYCRDREALAERAIKFFSTYCTMVARHWAGSEDGEAVVGYDAQDRILSLIHLDPLGIQMHLECPEDKDFEEALLYHNMMDRQDYERLREQKTQEDNSRS